MENIQVNIGDVVRHSSLAKRHKLYVANATDAKVLVRYVVDGIFHSMELFIHEIEPFVSEDDDVLV